MPGIVSIKGKYAMDGVFSFVEHDYMDAGGRVTQEQLPRDAINLYGTNLNSSAGPKGESQGCDS